MKPVIYFLALVFFVYNANSQTLEITAISDNTLCVGEQLDVTYQVNGTFNDNNVFVIQLSYPNGDFDNFYNIGNLKTQSSGIIECYIPETLTTNDDYRIRIISSNPYSTSSAYETGISISTLPAPAFKFDNFKYSFYKYIFNDEGLKITNTTLDDGEFFWEFGNDANPKTFTGYTPPLVNYATSGEKNIKLTNTNSGGCTKTTSYKTEISLLKCKPVIDSTSIVINKDTVNNSYEEAGTQVWICSNGKYSVINVSNSIIYVEPGGTLKILNHCAMHHSVIYLKPGACLEIQTGEITGVAVVKGPGSSINYTDEYMFDYIFIYECEGLEFDYKIAPEEGKIAMELGVDGLNPDYNISISPNPCNEFCTVTMDNPETGCRLLLANLLGDTIIDKVIPANAGNYTNIDFSGFSKGIYILKVITGKSIHYEKIIYQ